MNDKKIIAISAVMILFLISNSYLQSKKTRDIDYDSPSLGLPQLRIPSIEEITAKNLPTNIDGYDNQQNNNRDRTYRDERIQIDYPRGWESVNDFSGFMVSGEEEGLKLIFVSTPSPNTSLIALSVLEVKETETNKVLEKIIELYNENDIVIEIEEKESNEFYLFNGTYRGGKDIVLSREAIINFEDRSYIVSIFASQNEWDQYQDQINFIFNSIQIID